MTFPAGTNTTQDPNPNSFLFLVDPGNCLPPAVFEPDSTFTNGVAQLWLSASGGVHWGGAVVNLSLDGVNYHPIGDIENPARQGVLQRQLPSAGDPDTSNILAINLSPSRGVLDLDVTHDDADFVRSLCWVCNAFSTVAPCDGELLSYGDAVALTNNHHYRLTYLRRGQYGSTISAHPLGSFFTRIDTVASVGGDTLTLLRYDLPAGYVGVTLYLKFQSFNRFGESLQDLADVVEYTYTPCGIGHGTGTFGVPAIPTGFTCSALVGDSSTGSILLTWAPNPVADNVTKYEVYRAAGLAAPFSSATLIGTTTGTSYIDSALAVGTSWTHFVEACNIIGCSLPTAGCDATVAAASTGLPLCATPPTAGQVLVWDAVNNNWCPATLSDDDTCDMQNVDVGLDYTVALTKFDTQVIWNSTAPGNKTTEIPAAAPANKGFTLDIKTTPGDGSIHCITPASGTIGGIASVQFADAMTNLFLRSNADKNDWLIRCLCSYTPVPCTPFTVGAVSLDGQTALWNWPPMVDSPTGSMSVWLYISLSQFGAPAWTPDSPPGDLYDRFQGQLWANPQSNATNTVSHSKYVNVITTISSANPAVVTTNIVHGIPSGANILINISQIPPDAWNPVLANKTFTVTAAAAMSFTLDLDGTGLPAFTAFATVISVYNASCLLLATSDISGSPNYGTFTSAPLPDGMWVNVLMSWDMGHAMGGKSFTYYYNDTAVPQISTADGAAFSVGYGEPSAKETDSWWVGGLIPDESNGATGLVCYMAEFWFAAGQYLDFTDSAVRAKFHDGSGNAISLGDDGSLPTGTAPSVYLHLPAVAPDPYVTLDLPLRFINAAFNGCSRTADFDNAVTSSPLMVISYWVWGGDHIAVDMNHAAVETTLDQATTFVDLFDATGLNRFSFTFPVPSTPGPHNVCFAVDTNHAIGAKLVLAYVNNSAVSVTVTQDNADTWDIDWTANGFMGFAEDNGFTAEFWFAPGQYFDPVDKFIDGSGNPVDLGTDGSIPSGTAPSVYLSCRGSDPATAFAANRGTGGTLTPEGPLVLVPEAGAFLKNRAGTDNLALNSGWTSFAVAPTAPSTP